MTEHSLKLARWQKLAEIALKGAVTPFIGQSIDYSGVYDRAFMEWYAQKHD